MRHILLIITIVSFAFSIRAAEFDWPQWRGPNRDDISKETDLLTSWPANGPKRVWLFENAGMGYAGFAIVDGKVFTMGTRDDSEIVLMLDANTGRELWSAPVDRVFTEKRGNGPRGTPTVRGNHLYVMSGNGTVACVQVADGKVVWRKEMTELGGNVPKWGYTESVLVDGKHVLCTPGGSDGTITALDKDTGKVVWRSTGFTDEAQYASMVVAQINGKRQYVQLTMKNVVGLAPEDGKVLWKSAWPGRTAVVPTPIVRDNLVYVTSGYGVGCKQIKIEPDNSVTTVYENKVMKNHHGGVILVGDYIYGHADAGWTCQNFKTGEEVWNHRPFGKGAVAYADGMLYCQEEGSGTVALIEASPAGWKEHGRFRPEPQSKIRPSEGRIWVHPVISNGRLFLRDQELIYCYDVKKSS